MVVHGSVSLLVSYCCNAYKEPNIALNLPQRQQQPFLHSFHAKDRQTPEEGFLTLLFCARGTLTGLEGSEHQSDFCEAPNRKKKRKEERELGPTALYERQVFILEHFESVLLHEVELEESVDLDLL